MPKPHYKPQGGQTFSKGGGGANAPPRPPNAALGTLCTHTCTCTFACFWVVHVHVQCTHIIIVMCEAQTHQF